MPSSEQEKKNPSAKEEVQWYLQRFSKLSQIVKLIAWMLRGRNTVHRVISKCVRCRRFESRKITTNPAPLPEDRVNDATVFEVCGVGMAGPSLFLQGLRRFIAWRGTSRVMYSDNGTNFIRIDDGFDSLYWSKIEEEFCSRRIHWKFISPTAA
ncbi:hypothetical protein PR048_026375 [Dryococelus australis]|uniref:Integrase zinc-binding domain-containing protein n=1 Tax=Dryococelus australis TaxID=614101 RepID=A0ABQ9GL66_9NEOP|nr:hypothetical protein PR048_026375 [Dryococelus australis]